MLNAKSASEQSEANRIQNQKNDIETLIKKAIKKGRNKIFTTGMVPKEIKDELESAGYKVEVQAAGLKITW